LFLDLLVPEDKPIVDAGFQALLGGTILRHDVRILHADGHIRWVELKVMPTLDSAGKLVRIDGIASDITGRKQSEKALRRSEQRFRDMFDNAPVGYHEIDMEGKIVEVNQTELDLLGYTREEMMGAFVWTFIEDSESSRTRVLGKLQGLLPPGEGTERKYHRKDNSLIILLVEDRFLRNENEQITGLRSALQDITEKIKVKEELQKFLLATEQSPVSILITNYDGVIEYVNKGFCQMTNYSKEDVIGKNHRAFYSNPDHKIFNKILWDTILSGKDFKGEIMDKKKTGELYWEFVIVFPLVNKDGTTTHFVGIREDITERKRMIEELIGAKERAEEMNKLKSNFLANMSHELRTPLIGILGFSDILTAELENDEQITMAETIYKSGERLKNTLNMILDLSKVEAKQINLLNETQNLLPIVQTCIDLYSGAAREKGLYLKTEITSSYFPVNIDKRLLIDILNNLFSNAIVYTEAGGITVTINTQLIDNKDWVCINIADTGIGINKKDFALIFEEFRQVSEGLSRSFEGTGLGLTLAKKYVELMHGVITLESELGMGSTFTIKFPLVDTAVSKDETRLPISPIRSEMTSLPKNLPSFLYVEDDEISRQVVERMLRGICSLEFANSGLEALERASKKEYACILMDINLGRGIDGTSVTIELRKLPNYAATPIIAVTAFALVKDKDDFIKAGCSDYISKPFTKQELIDIIMKNSLEIHNERG